MPIYMWKGTDRKGSRQKGEIETDNVAIARQLLLRKGVNVKSVKTKPKDISEYITLLQPRVKEKDMVVFVRQFATMIDAGLPIMQCLEILREQQSNQTLKRIIKEIRRDVEEGATFSDAIRKHPKVFDDLFVNLIAAGEVSGILDVILNRLAVYIEKMASLKKKIKGAMTYPAIVVGVAVVVIAVILIYVIPVFAGLFRDAGVSLPPLTLFVMNLSAFVQSYFHWAIVGFILFVIGIRRARRTSRGREWTDQILLKLPVFGLLLRKVAIARFTRTLGTMLESGVPILESLEVVSSATGNKVIENAIRKARIAIAEGHPV
ncbi:MAG: type II secretion system F family protein, partial [Desulfoferrobacter sp.]